MDNAKARRERIIERVRALLAMTVVNGCTEAEAMLAAAKAAKLMEEYDLAVTNVKSFKDERIAQQSKPFAATERSREIHAAGIYVAMAVAEFFDCKCWRNHTEIIFFRHARRRAPRSCHARHDPFCHGSGAVHIPEEQHCSGQGA